MSKAKEPRVAARIPEALRKKLTRALKTTNMSDTDFVVVALEEFLEAHKTPADKISAIIRRRAGQAGAAK